MSKWRMVLLACCCTAALTGFACLATAQETQRQKPEQSQQQNQYRDQSQDLQEDQQQKPTQSYSGKVSEKFGKYYLEDKRTRTSYLLQGSWDLKRFIDKKVRVTGSLDTDKDILHVVAITVAP
ncbi:MAG TPA: hypothetical protein VMU53_19440 [Candidatus Sulfotelmatobacter sp.]|nr:hypothetical protein [Candidatus Sulfotelmatobacter sp.]